MVWNANPFHSTCSCLALAGFMLLVAVGGSDHTQERVSDGVAHAGVSILKSTTVTPPEALRSVDLASSWRGRLDADQLIVLVHLPHVQHFLELVPQQIQDIEAAREHALARLEALASSPDNFVDPEPKAIVNQYERTVRDIILPHQWSALDKYLMRLAINQHGIVALLVDGPLGRELELSDAQKTEIVEEATALRSELIEELERLERRAMRRMLSSLEPAQRAKVEDLISIDSRPTPQRIVSLIRQLEYRCADCD